MILAPHHHNKTALGLQRSPAAHHSYGRMCDPRSKPRMSDVLSRRRRRPLETAAIKSAGNAVPIATRDHRCRATPGAVKMAAHQVNGMTTRP